MNLGFCFVCFLAGYEHWGLGSALGSHKWGSGDEELKRWKGMCDLRACWDMNMAFFSSVLFFLLLLLMNTNLAPDSLEEMGVYLLSWLPVNMRQVLTVLPMGTPKTPGKQKTITKTIISFCFLDLCKFLDFGLEFLWGLLSFLVRWNFLSGKEGARIPTLWTASRLPRIK